MDHFMLSAFAPNGTLAFRAPQDQPSQSPELTPLNVALALLFVVFDSALSVVFGLGIASSLLVAASRCILQLSIMGLVLQKVFDTGNIFGVFGIAGMSSLRLSSHKRETVLISAIVVNSPSQCAWSHRGHI